MYSMNSIEATRAKFCIHFQVLVGMEVLLVWEVEPLFWDSWEGYIVHTTSGRRVVLVGPEIRQPGLFGH